MAVLPTYACLDKMIHDYDPCLVESDKQQIKEVRSKTQPETGKLLSESGFVPRVAPPSLSRDRRIKNKEIAKLVTSISV